MRIYIYGKTCRGDELNAVVKMINHIASEHHEIVADGAFYSKLPSDVAIHLPISDVVYNSPDKADLAISIGGDGTFLRTTKKVAHLGIPIAGINTGQLGYLSAVELNELSDFTNELLSGRYDIERRSLLSVSREDGLPIDVPLALNEVAFLRHDISSVINIHVEVNGVPLTTYKSDGLIVSTPTGSTAYNLSCGGPIIAPTAANLVLTPVSPHSLNMRPLVLPDNASIRVVTNSRSMYYQLSLDGNTSIMPDGSAVLISKAPYVVNVVQRKGHNFAQTLRQKLLWGEDIR